MAAFTSQPVCTFTRTASNMMEDIHAVLFPKYSSCNSTRRRVLNPAWTRSGIIPQRLGISRNWQGRGVEKNCHDYSSRVTSDLNAWSTSCPTTPFPSSFTRVCSTYFFQTEAVDEIIARVKGYLSPGRDLRKGLGAFGIRKPDRKRAESPSVCKSSHCEQPLVLNGV